MKSVVLEMRRRILMKIKFNPDDNTQPFKEAKDGWENVTVEELIKMLQALPKECQKFDVTFDSGFGGIMKRDLTIMPKGEKISLNG